jgi:hypothetical protein
MSTHLTTQELDAALAKYRGEIIPADALSVMDAETEALRASGIERRALKPGAVAPDFMLPDEGTMLDGTPLGYDSSPTVELTWALILAHIGYVSRELFRTFYGDTVRNIAAWLDQRAKATDRTSSI